MLYGLPAALASVNAGNRLNNLLNETRKMVYSFYRAKEVIKKYITI